MGITTGKGRANKLRGQEYMAKDHVLKDYRNYLRYIRYRYKGR
jgi:hypothetical protein